MKNQKGITLISLVITIVILIILAGVAINMTLGENGILTKAKEAKKMQTIAAAKEQIGLEILEAQIEAIDNNEELEQSEVESIVSKYGALQADGDTIILNDSGYEVSLREIYNEMAEAETDGDTTTELAQLKALLAQTTVTEDKILKDYKAYKDGQLITGTMESYAGQTQDATATSDDTYTYLSIPNNGYYTTESKLRMEKNNINNNLSLVGYLYRNSWGVTSIHSDNITSDANWDTTNISYFTNNTTEAHEYLICIVTDGNSSLGTTISSVELNTIGTATFNYPTSFYKTDLVETNQKIKIALNKSEGAYIIQLD